VLPAYGIGLRLGGRRAAGIGALLVACNPFLVWYSQEARMFMPATAFALVGLYGAVRLADDDADASSTALSALLIVAGFTAALYSYLFSAFLLPVAAAWVVVLAWRARRTGGARIAAGGLAALGLTALLFLPLARSAWQVSGAEAAPGRAFAGMPAALWRQLGVYTLGWPGWPANVKGVLTGGAALLAAAGLVVTPGVGFDRARRAGGLLLALWLGLPLLAGGLLLARDRTVFAESRYFIFLVPALCLTWGRALAWLVERRRAVGLLGLALMFGVTIAGLPSLWTPENRKEAWREAAAFVAAQAGPNDAVLIQADYVRPAFERYFSGPQPVFTPFTEWLADQAQVDAPLEGLKEFDAVWLVESHQEDRDPGGLVAGWFAARNPLITEVFPPGVSVRGYLQAYRRATLPAGLTAASVTADAAGPQMVACTYQPERLAARDELFHPPSGWVHAVTYWAPGVAPGAAAAGADASPVAQMVDAAGQVWGQSLDRAGDAFERWPPSGWQPGEVVRVDHEVNLNPATPPGRYRLVVGQPGGGQFTCGEVEIVE
jgi:hypothetical protein